MAIVSILFGVGLMAYWLLFPQQVLKIHDGKFKIANKIVEQGGKLVYTTTFCKYQNIPVQITRTMTDGLIFQLPPMTSNLPIGCQTRNVAVEIPHSLPVGTYTMQSTFQYKMNPLRDFVFTVDSEEFYVVKGK